jgi:hypothetical protein
LAEATGWRQTSFSSYVRAEALRREVARNRRELQDLGAAMIEEQGFTRFVAGMLAEAELDPDAPFVVEGVRHLGTLAALRELTSPMEVRFLYLDVSDAERNRRLAAEGVSAEEGAEWEEHSTEAEVLEGLPEVADLVIDADQPADSVAKTALAFLGHA